MDTVPGEFIFGVDLDGVVADFIRGLRPLAAEWLGVPEDELCADPTYGFPEWGLDATKYERLHRWAVTAKDLFCILPVIPGASQALRRLSDDDIHIRIITHRLYTKYTHQKAVTQTVEWLDRQDIPYWDLCFMAEKSAVDADIYVEDTPKNIYILKAKKRPVIVFSNSTNRDVNTDLRGDDWSQVEAIVQRHAEEWRHGALSDASDSA